MKDKNDHIISIFESVFKTIPCGEISVSDFVGGIKYEKWKKETESLRNEKNPEIQKKIKVNLPAVTISGIFTQRKESCLLKHSDFICIDVDDFTDRTRLISDIYTYALFSTVSNTGLAVLVKIDGEKHKESFRWLRNHYFNNYGIVIDSAPQNCASLRTVSYDANCYINEKSKKSKTLSDKPLQINSLPVIIPNDKVGEMVRDTVQRGINIAETYNDYVMLAFALASGLGEEGRQYFHSLASVSDKYKAEHANKQYTIALKRPTGKITIGSFYWMLKNAGIEFPQSKKYEAAIRATVLQKKANRSEKSAVNLLKEIYGHEEAEAVQIAKEVFKRGDISLAAIAADPEKLIESLVAWVQINHPMKKNLLTGRIENSTGELTKEDLNTIYLQARACFNTPNVTFDLFERIVFSNFTPQYHPIKKYIEENRHRNTIGNINNLVNSVKTTTPEARMFIRKWLLSIPAAVEGYPVRLVLALLGKQLTGKCLARGTKILMYDLTIKNVEDILPGEQLLGIDGNPRNVLSICNGKEMMYKINQLNGNLYIVNESHILSLKHRINKKIINVNILDYLKWSNSEKTKWYGYKGMYKSIKNITLPIDPYFLGVWLGDGRSNFMKCGVQIEQLDNEIVIYLKEFAKNNGWFISKYRGGKNSKSNSYGIVIATGSGHGKKGRIGNRNNHIKYKLFDLGLNNNKHIPHIYQQSSMKQRLELLAGIIDTDGYIDKRTGSMGITMVNKKLSEDILFLCRGLGFKCSINIKMVNGKEYCRIHIGGNLKKIPCKIQHKKGFNNYTYDSTQTGISVSQNGYDDYFGFEIDGDKLFMLSDFTVTHNTEFFRRLLPDKLKKYYGESKLDAGKDDELLMTQKLILMDDEMSGKNKNDEKRFKDLTSKHTFSLREPYGKTNQDYRRIAVLCGTSNDREIINDPTGNTRILPVEIERISYEEYNSVDKDELFMEIVRAYEGGEDWNFTIPELENLTETTLKYEAIPFERELILKHFTTGDNAEGYGYVEEMSATEIKNHIELWTKQQIRSLKRLGMELRKIFGERKLVRRPGGVVSVYCVVKLSPPAEKEADTKAQFEPAPF